MRLIVVSLVLLLTGCATITGTETQPISITTQNDDGELVQSARCTLRNDKGVWSAMSPGFVNVGRSAEDLVIDCRKQGLPDGFARAISRAHGGMFGNIIFGGGIGAIIDHSKGTGYDYPNTIPVRMGRSVVIDRSTQAQVQEEPISPSQQVRTPVPSAPPPAQQSTQGPPSSTATVAVPSHQAAAYPGSELAGPRYAGIEFPAPQQPPTKPPKVPAMSFEVEKLARSHGCTGSKSADLLTEPGVIETYRVRCDGGGEVIIKCEYRNCRVLN